jgi:tetratricopeptide (TPR) repeat protein
MESLERNVVTFQGDLRYERSGATGSVPVTSRAWLSYCHTERGAFPEALAMAEDGLRIAETVQSPFNQIEAWYGVSLVYQRQGDVPRAIPGLERAVGLCQEWHIPLLWPVMAAALGLAYTLEGRDAAGLALVEQGVAQQVARSRRRRLASALIGISEAYLWAGRLDEACQHAAQALDHARQYQQRGNQAWALWLMGESTARKATPEVALATVHYHQALALAEALGMRPLQAHCHRGLGTLYATISQREQARTALSTAIEMYTSMEMTFWLQPTEAALAQVEGQ